MEITKQEFKTKSLKVTKEMGRILKEIENNLDSSRPEAQGLFNASSTLALPTQTCEEQDAAEQNSLDSSRPGVTSIQSVIKQTHIELNKLEVLIRQPN